jgi:hypothetical protein
VRRLVGVVGVGLGWPRYSPLVHVHFLMVQHVFIDFKLHE